MILKLCSDYLIVDHYERKTYALILQLLSSYLVRHDIAVTYFPSYLVRHDIAVTYFPSPFVFVNMETKSVSMVLAFGKF